MPPPTLSVGIPAYNQGAFLPETLDSLLSQTVMPLEIVVSNHGSTDNTAAVIAEYEARYPGVVRGVQPPAGTTYTGQWNFTFGHQTGDWITLLSSDDVARPNFVETLLRGASRRDDAVMVRAGWENIDKNGKVLSKEYLLSVDKVALPPASLLEQRYGPKASFAAFAVKRSTFQESGGYPEGFESFGDWPLFMQIAPYGATVYENEIVSGYRVGHDGDKFRARAGMWIRDEIRMFTEVMPRAAAHAGMTDTGWISEAFRANFERYLGSASEKYKPEERGPMVPLFKRWAELVEGQALLARFAAGEALRKPQTLTARVKRMLRPTVQKAYALLHSR
jgi:glycosyltransferase involved in cell wall biosynthesis